MSIVSYLVDYEPDPDPAENVPRSPQEEVSDLRAEKILLIETYRVW